MQRTAFLIGQVVILIVDNEVEFRAIGQSRRLVQNDVAVLHAGSQVAHAATIRRPMVCRKRGTPNVYKGYVPNPVRGVDPRGAARRYCVGQETFSPAAAATCNGQ
jgi:hypothetical protein